MPDQTITGRGIEVDRVGPVLESQYVLLKGSTVLWSTKYCGTQISLHLLWYQVDLCVEREGESQHLLTITPAAKVRFRDLTDVEIPEGLALRLDTLTTSHNAHAPSIAMYVGEPEQDDRAVEHEGETLLYVSGAVAQLYAGCVLDLEEGPEGVRFGVGPRPRLGTTPAPRRRTSMTSEEALIGMRVRVRDSLLRSELRGQVGTITARWGSPEYVALDVLLDDGRSQLFWHHELEEHNGAA